MSMSSMSNILNQIQFQAHEISSTQQFDSPGEIQKGDNKLQFSNILFNSLNEINQSQVQAKTQSEGFISGTSNIGLNDVMVSLQKSSLELNLGVQVRNKLVSAYQDVMNMPV
ncbi:flagellar hook-basal body complex protein FliE [Enterobacter pasteurii]|uniref:flagellar hook-basal body complex protein FliE n=1 Tax=Enterobacter pasteurii TaxID=3029761 RepID=UPI0011DD938B|nr:flagellar hook-basal body complex protein FliE [Enterobacter pasteurii]QLA68087.1 flagellar hook-basal body complex protein FliE [Enterobacter pasteurii]